MLEKASFPSLEYIEDIYHKIHIFYQIPYDAGMGREIKFDLQEFCKHFSLERSMARHAVEYLDRSGHFSFSEDVEIQTRVQILPDRVTLGTIDLPEPLMVSFLEVLMRSYTALFNYPVPISEEQVARKLGIGVPALRQLMFRLSQLHVIRYIPQDESSVIFLRHDRWRPGNVNLQPAVYKRLHASWVERTTAMRGYVECTTCRAQYLLSYFAQEDSAPCGKCDVCRG